MELFHFTPTYVGMGRKACDVTAPIETSSVRNKTNRGGIVVPVKHETMWPRNSVSSALRSAYAANCAYVKCWQVLSREDLNANFRSIFCSCQARGRIDHRRRVRAGGPYLGDDFRCDGHLIKPLETSRWNQLRSHADLHDRQCFQIPAKELQVELGYLAIFCKSLT